MTTTDPQQRLVHVLAQKINAVCQLALSWLTQGTDPKNMLVILHEVSDPNYFALMQATFAQIAPSQWPADLTEPAPSAIVMAYFSKTEFFALTTLPPDMKASLQEPPEDGCVHVVVDDGGEGSVVAEVCYMDGAGRA